MPAPTPDPRDKDKDAEKPAPAATPAAAARPAEHRPAPAVLGTPASQPPHGPQQAPPIQQAPVPVFMVPASALPQAAPERDPNSPYTGPSEMVPGGRFLQGTRMQGGKHYGGRIVDANGRVLATFDDKAENTGNPAHGEKPEE
jgi:hypothetical protein